MLEFFLRNRQYLKLLAKTLPVLCFMRDTLAGLERENVFSVNFLWRKYLYVVEKHLLCVASDRKEGSF